MEKSMMRILGEDRTQRYILYTLLVIFIVIPVLRPIGLPIPINESTRMAYEKIESVAPGTVVAFIPELGPEMLAEMGPGAVALAKHLFSKPVKILIFAHGRQASPQLTEDMILSKPEIVGNKKYGVDYVHFGYYAGEEMAVAAFAKDTWSFLRSDVHGTPVEQLPMMQNIRSGRDVGLVVICYTLDYFLRQLNAPYGTPIVTQTYGIMYPVYLPYLKTGQVAGMLNSIRGAAEYEVLIHSPGLAAAATDALSMTHVLVIGAIALANLRFLYAMSRRSKR